MAQKINPEYWTQLKSLVEDLRSLEYPSVWVGKVGMTAEQLLRIQEMNEELAESMRLEAGEFVASWVFLFFSRSSRQFAAPSPTGLQSHA